MIKRKKDLSPFRKLTVALILLTAVMPASFAQKFTPANWIHHSIDSMMPGSEWGTSGFTLADFDRDGDLDITISRREISNGKVYWYENKSGTWIRHDLGISDEEQLGATVADINGDGFPDLIMGRYWFANPGVLNRYPDSLWTRHIYAGGLPRENHDVEAYDFDNDGKKEILCYSQKAGGGTLRLYKTVNPDNWSFRDISDSVNATVKDIPGNNGIHGGFSPGGIGDLDGDGFADIVMPAGWYRNPGLNSGGAWEYRPWPFHEGIVPNLYGISGRSWMADIDADGDQDVVFVDCDVESSKGYLFINEGNGKTFKRVALPSPGAPTGSYHSLAVADFDNDGDLDIFTGEQEDPSVGMKLPFLKERGFFWENTGTSTDPSFVVRIIQTDNPGWHDVQIGDVDGDGDIDIVSKVWFRDGKYYHADYWENAMNSNNGKKFVKTTYTYKKAGDLSIRADVYRKPGNTIQPAILWLHGGALIMGNRRGLNGIQAEKYLDAGYTIVAIDYRLAPQVKAKDILEDLKDAYAWMRTKGPGLFMIDPDRIAVVGHSAGGYLSLMAGCILKPAPRAIVSFYGYGDVAGEWYSRPDPFYSSEAAVSKDEAFRSVGTNVISDDQSHTRERFYLYCRQKGLWPLEVTGYDPDREPGKFDQYCPIRNVTASYPPALLLHGDKDTDVPYGQSVMMIKKLKSKSVDCELITMPDKGHGFDYDMGNPEVDAAFEKVLRFLDSRMKQKDASVSGIGQTR